MSSLMPRFLAQGQRLAKNVSQPCIFNALRSLSTLKHEGIEVTLTKNPKPKIHEQVKSPNEILFGKHFSDHMLLCNWDKDEGWARPKIVPFGDISVSPAMSALHYATECFEGLKAYRGDDEKIRLFRPAENMKRLNNSATAASLPNFDGEEFLECTKDLIRIDKEWVPRLEDCSLYIRPTFIGTEPAIGVHASSTALLYCIIGPAGPYFSTGTFAPVSLYADPGFVRAWPGGCGESKMGGNYGPTIRIAKVAAEKGCTQVLWLLGEDEQLTEVGTMNIFVHWINEKGDPEIVTPPLGGTILPGVTRKSLLELGATWETHRVIERDITMYDIRKAVSENRIKEIFGSGTACVVCPVERILYKDENIIIPTTNAGVAQRFYKELTDIQYGRSELQWANKDWTVVLE